MNPTIMQYKAFSILIADDDAEDLELIEEAIHNMEPDADLHLVTNGKAVIEFLQPLAVENLPCLIVLDYNMPELNGSQVLSQICAEARYDDIPKIILSTSSAPLHIEECMSNGATEYWVKPNNMKDLDTLARKILDICKAE